MNSPAQWTLYGLWGVIVALGVAVAIVAIRAAGVSRSPALRLFAVGVLLISVVAATAWLGLATTQSSPIVSDVGAFVAMAAGLVAVLSSVYIRGP